MDFSSSLSYFVLASSLVSPPFLPVQHNNHGVEAKVDDNERGTNKTCAKEKIDYKGMAKN
jgi:hypothetical protein